MSSDNLKSKMIGSLAWTSIDRFGQQIIQFIVSVILARLLTPNEYTLIALIVVFISLSNTLVDGGLGSALVRKKNVDITDYSTVFYFNVIISIFLYIFLYFLAPFIADFYKQPQLIQISRILFISILFNAFYLIPNVKLVRKIDVKRVTIVNLVSVTISGVIGITLAMYNFGVWALVGQQLSFQFLRMLIVFYFETWKPKLIFRFNVIKESFGFSFNILGTTLLNNIFNYIYVLVLGRFFPKQEVGLYYQANKLNDATSFSLQVILGSTYNVFVKIQDDTERFLRIYRELVRKSSVFVIPLILFLISVADPLINVLFTAKWAQTVPYFQMLCLASLFNPLYTLIVSALNARGKSKITFRIEFLKKALIVTTIIICLRFGIIALLAGYCFANWVTTFTAVMSIKKELKHYWLHQFKDILPSILMGVVLMTISYGISFLISNQLILLITQFICCAIAYFIMLKLFFYELIRNFFTFVNVNIIHKYLLKKSKS